MKLIPLLALLIIFQACNENDIYKYDEPLIVKNLEMKLIANDEDPDSCLISFLLDHQFEFGINPEEFLYPWHVYDIVYDSNDSIVKFGKNPTPPFYAKRPNGDTYPIELDSLPGTKCYSLYKVSDESHEDTIVVHPNFYRNNIIIKLLDRNGTDLLDTNGHDCNQISYNGRVPYIPYTFSNIKTQYFKLSPFRIELVNKYQRKIKYFLYSSFWQAILSSREFRLELQVIDRELNVSKKYYTDYMTLEDILVKK